MEELDEMTTTTQDYGNRRRGYPNLNSTPITRTRRRIHRRKKSFGLCGKPGTTIQESRRPQIEEYFKHTDVSKQPSYWHGRHSHGRRNQKGNQTTENEEIIRKTQHYQQTSQKLPLRIFYTYSIVFSISNTFRNPGKYNNYHHDRQTREKCNILTSKAQSVLYPNSLKIQFSHVSSPPAKRRTSFPENNLIFADHLTTCRHLLKNNLQKGRASTGVFLHIKMAFDRVWQTCLAVKMT